MKAIRPFRPLLSLLGLAALLTGAAVIALAEATPARRTLIVSSTFGDAPYSFNDAQGKPAGFDVELIRAVANASGMDVAFETAGPTQEHAPDVILGAWYSTPVASGIAEYCAPHSVREHAVFVRGDSLYRELRDLADRALAAPGDNRALPWLESHGFGPGLVPSGSIAEAFESLASGAIEAVICDRYQGLAIRKSGGFEALRVLPDAVAPIEYGFAVASADSKLADALNSGLRVVEKTGQAKRLRTEWLESLEPAPAKMSLGAIYSLLLWLVLPLALLIGTAAAKTITFRKRAALRITTLERELAAARQSFDELRNERARQRYVINQLSTVSLVDQIVEASRH